jgi:hypothetical protein
MKTNKFMRKNLAYETNQTPKQHQIGEEEA